MKWVFAALLGSILIAQNAFPGREARPFSRNPGNAERYNSGNEQIYRREMRTYSGSGQSRPEQKIPEHRFQEGWNKQDAPKPVQPNTFDPNKNRE